MTVFYCLYISTECASFKTTRNKLQDCSCLQCDPDYVADVLMTRLADDSSEVVDKILDVGQVCKDRGCMLSICVYSEVYIV